MSLFARSTSANVRSRPARRRRSEANPAVPGSLHHDSRLGRPSRVANVVSVADPDDLTVMTVFGVIMLLGLAALLSLIGYGVIQLNRRQRAKLHRRRAIVESQARHFAQPARRPEHFVVLVLSAGAAALLIFDVGGLAVPLAALGLIAILMVPDQRRHNAARASAIAEYRRTRDDLDADERQRRLEFIGLAYGHKHPAVRRLIAEEQRQPMKR